MPSAELINEAARQMVICNACRYCEGYCAVFPAMELRQTFEKSDILYLANVCFDCRDCYYACQFAPPHEFAVNVPQVFAELRSDTYRDFSWPGALSGLFKRNGLAVALITLISIAVVLVYALASQGSGALFGRHVGEGSFYKVVPYLAMVLPASLMLLYAVGVLVIGSIHFWRETSGNIAAMINPDAFRRATADAFSMRYMKGGGVGCNYPNADFSNVRRWYHHLVFYGFLFDLASTTLAAIYDHLLHWEAPYPLLSWPVVLGTIGGVMLMIGTAGLLGMKCRSDRDPAGKRMLTMDVAFLVLLFLTAATGLLLLVLRDTTAMGTLLVVHLGIVAGLFLTIPYGKFAHVAYRYTALVRNSIEQAQAQAAPAGGH